MILAHAFGARYDLPIPLKLFIISGAVVVLVSFLLVVSRKVASAPTDAQRPDRPTIRSSRRVPGQLALAGLVFGLYCGFAGSQEIPENILPTVFWLFVWIGIPLSCGLIGDWTQELNPFAYLAKLVDRAGLRRALLGTPDPVNWPKGLGWWPAVLLYFLTSCGELIFNLTVVVPHNTALALLIYAFFSMAMSLVFGRAWLERGELFTVLYSTWGRLGYFRFGAPGRRRFAGGLEVPFEATASRIAFVLLLLVSVNFDGLLATPSYLRFESSLPSSLAAPGTRLDLFRVLAMVTLAASIAVVFGLFAWAAARVGRQGTGVRASVAGLLPSVLPIAFGYLLAHNCEYLAVNSQLILPLIGDPTGLASWPLHLPYPFNDAFEPKIHFLPPSFYWYFSVAVIVLVHVIAVFQAHKHLARRSATVIRARRSEAAWLVAMVAYTMLSLWLIAQPIAKTGPNPTSTAATGEPAGRQNPATSRASNATIASRNSSAVNSIWDSSRIGRVTSRSAEATSEM